MKTGDLHFTGERFVPGEGGAQMAYEHLHRYILALEHADGKRVLDVASGSGYGAALLARAAREVLAVDIDGATVSDARSRYLGQNLAFVQADAVRLPVRSSSIDLVVAFEVLEHVADQDALVKDLARVLRPDGMAMISTPDKATYSDARQYKNPYHVREFYRGELEGLLREHFQNVWLMEQQVRAGSLIRADRPDPSESGRIILDPPPGAGRKPVSSMYFVAVCSHERGAGRLSGPSAYLDLTDYLFEDWARECARLNREIQELGRWGKAMEEDLKAKDEILRGILEQVSERDRTIESLQAVMRREMDSRDAELVRLQQEFEDRSRWVQSLHGVIEERDATIERTASELERVGAHLARIRHAFLYRVLCRAGILPK